jgi:hypothetical protein
MRRTILVALAIGLVLGVIAATGGVMALGQGSVVLPPSAHGDPNAPYDIEVIVTDALLTDQFGQSRPAQPACATAATPRPAPATPAASAATTVAGTPSASATPATLGRSVTPADERQLEDVRVRLFDDGTLLVQGTTTLYGLSLPARVVLKPGVVDGFLEFAVVTSEVGRFRLPTTASEQIADVLNQQLRASMADQSFRLVALTPGQGTLAVRLQFTGTPRAPGQQPPGRGC